ncbi:Transcription initiation factor TFIID subunit 6 [Neolecta irregularis DAH-3]|uniref:TBP-associated factor 6 n=1 Tax=Neolecta irregularis (strain DAH-3) TaxID=1198029 RepID=A0A1U7LQ03_NEOID|nr:Transcription initiation factor TFIID subunit 6 [Neolecta irregularis DAH-3]|eukprot:OLL24601.1 Transcription initiation factor TFIID subunit 6 [Neolecta irregularis DAH-3]
MQQGVLSNDTIKDAAENLGIANLSEEVSKALALDVEYRMKEVIQEAMKFMRHAKRTILSTNDISHALRTLKLEPLYGYGSSRPMNFREAHYGQSHPIYYLDDDEIEFEKVINSPLPKVPREVAMTAHWLAIEGVQPSIPQNPTVDATTTFSSSSEGGKNSISSSATEVKPLVKHVLSEELQIYFDRVSKALLDQDNESLRNAALASLSHDPGLHQLLPYLVQYIAEKVTHNLKSLSILQIMMQTVYALLSNPNLFLEPYVHQLVPSVLTCLISKRLGPDLNREHYQLRDYSASILKLLLDKFSDSYHTLKPRITRTLLKAFLDNKKPFTTHYGALRGLTILGREVVRVLIAPNAIAYSVLIEKEINDGNFEAEKVLISITDSLESLVDPELSDLLQGKSEEEIIMAMTEKLGQLVVRRLWSNGKGMQVANTMLDI